MSNLTYVEPHPITRTEANSAFESKEPTLICMALINLAFHDPEWRWVQDKCLEFAPHPDADIRGLAATCFGHLVRIHGELDLDKVTPVLQQLLVDREPYVRGCSQGAVDDIKMFMNVEIELQDSNNNP